MDSRERSHPSVLRTPLYPISPAVVRGLWAPVCEAVSVLKLANLFCSGFAGVAPVHAPQRAVFRSVGSEPEEQKGHLQSAKQPRRTERSRHRPLLRGQPQWLLGGAAEHRSEEPGCLDPQRRGSRLPEGKGRAQNGRREDKMLEQCEAQPLQARQCLTCRRQPGIQRTTGHCTGPNGTPGCWGPLTGP